VKTLVHERQVTVSSTIREGLPAKLRNDVLCRTVVHNDTRTHNEQFLKMSVRFRLRFSFCVC